MRVLVGIRKHFRTRAAEWVMAIGMIAEGVLLLAPGDTLGSARAFSYLKALADDNFWGGIETALGAAWMIALVLNGTFSNFRRVSPWVRAVMAGASAAYLTAFASGMKIGNPAGTGFLDHAWLALMALVLCIFTAAEVADADEEAKRCRRRRKS